jgi:hypothetical protein
MQNQGKCPISMVTINPTCMAIKDKLKAKGILFEEERQLRVMNEKRKKKTKRNLEPDHVEIADVRRKTEPYSIASTNFVRK